MNKLKPIYFYISYFLLNLANSYIVVFGIIHPNISSYSFDFNSFLFSLIGNIGVLSLFYVISIIIFNRTKHRINFLVGISIIFTLLSLGTAIFANIFSTFFTLTQLSSFNNPSQGSFFVYYAKYSLSMIMDFTQMIHLLIFILLIIISGFTDKKEIRYHSPLYKSMFLIISICFMFLPIVNLTSKVKDTIYSTNLNAQYGSTNLGLYDYYFYDAYKYYFRDNSITLEEQVLIEKYISDSQNLTYTNFQDQKTYTINNEYTNLANNMNLIMIQLEAINTFLIDLEVDGIEITPNLNKLVDKSLYFNRFYSAAGIGNTSDSEFSSLTGLYGNGNELTIFDYSGKNYETLAKDFKKSGYQTFSTHGNIGEFYYRSSEHLNTLGFDTHYDLKYFNENYTNVPLIHSYLDDQFFFEKTVDLMPADEKFFAFLIAVTSHTPYVPTEEIYAHNFKGLTKLASSYLDFVKHVDDGIPNLIAGLEEKGLLENSILVFFGDHTSSLFGPDMESILNQKIKPIDLRLMLQSTPLIIYNENLFEPAISDKVVSTVDFYRSFSNLFGLNSKYYFNNDIFTQEPGFVYSPRNLDLIYQETVIEYPSKRVHGDLSQVQQYIEYFEKLKIANDGILKSRYFK